MAEIYAVVCEDCGRLNTELMPSGIANDTKERHLKYSYGDGCEYVDIVVPEAVREASATVGKSDTHE